MTSKSLKQLHDEMMLDLIEYYNIYHTNTYNTLTLSTPSISKHKILRSKTPSSSILVVLELLQASSTKTITKCIIYQSKIVKMASRTDQPHTKLSKDSYTC